MRAGYGECQCASQAGVGRPRSFESVGTDLAPPMRCPTLAELPPPPHGKKGWPWTDETPSAADAAPDGSPWPKVSVVMNSLNHGEFIEQAIRSVLLQGYPALEYIIIDGCSRDRSADVIRKYEHWLGHWVSEPDEGPHLATIKGAAIATGNVFGLMCADDFYLPGAIRKLVELRCASPDAVAWVGSCPAVNSGDEVEDQGIPFIRSLDRIGDWGVGGWFNSIACLFDAESYRAVGGLDQRFKNGSDVDLWIKLSMHGRFALTMNPVAIHRRNLQSVSNRDSESELSSWIASNYINGHREVARSILVRFAERRVAQATARLSIADFTRLKCLRAVSRARRGADVLKDRVFGSRFAGADSEK